MITTYRLEWNWNSGHTYTQPTLEQFEAVIAGTAEPPAGYTYEKKTFGEGATTKVANTCERIMSDVWEYQTFVYWIDADGNERREYLSGEESARLGTCATRRVEYTIDATPESLARRDARVAKMARLNRLDREIMAECKVVRGVVVKVVRGRNVPKGTTGEVIWTGADKFRRGATRIGVKDEAGTVHWTAGSNVDIVQNAQHEAKVAEYQALRRELFPQQA
jgi:hypothetical protein